MAAPFYQPSKLILIGNLAAPFFQSGTGFWLFLLEVVVFSSLLKPLRSAFILYNHIG